MENKSRTVTKWCYKIAFFCAVVSCYAGVSTHGHNWFAPFLLCNLVGGMIALVGWLIGYISEKKININMFDWNNTIEKNI